MPLDHESKGNTETKNKEVSPARRRICALASGYDTALLNQNVTLVIYCYLIGQGELARTCEQTNRWVRSKLFSSWHSFIYVAYFLQSPSRTITYGVHSMIQDTVQRNRFIQRHSGHKKTALGRGSAYALWRLKPLATLIVSGLTAAMLQVLTIRVYILLVIFPFPVNGGL